MTKFEKVLLFTLVLLVIGGIIFGFLTTIRKSFREPQTEKLNTSEIMAEQKRRNREVWERQERLMQDQQQKIRDLQKK